MMSDKISIEKIHSVVASEIGDKAAFIFLLGSAGTDRFHSESDIDLAVYFKVKPSYDELSKISIALMAALDRDCDLVMLNDVDLIFSRQVLETGRELIVNDRSSLNIWKTQQLSMYPDFKESRKIIEDNLLNRKKYV